MPAIPVIDVDGRKTEVRFDSEHPTVLYLLSPQCIWCSRNEANIRALALASSERYRFVGVSTQPTDIKAYRRESQMPFPIFVISSHEEAVLRHLVGTPQTAVILAGGRVAATWSGAYESTNQRVVEDYFHVKLPGLAPDLANTAQTALASTPAKPRTFCLDDKGLSYSKGATIRDKNNQTITCNLDGQWSSTH